MIPSKLSSANCCLRIFRTSYVIFGELANSLATLIDSSKTSIVCTENSKFANSLDIPPPAHPTSRIFSPSTNFNVSSTLSSLFFLPPF